MFLKIFSQVFPRGVVEHKNSEGTRLKVNGQGIKLYQGNEESVQKVVNSYYRDEFCVIKSPAVTFQNHSLEIRAISD